MNLLPRRADGCVKAICSTQPKESPMLRKSTLLAVAASAALGLAMLAPTAASAHGGHGGGGGHGGHGGGGWGGHGGYHQWHYGYRRPIWYARPVVYSVARPVAVSSPGPCTCLSKEYTPEGAVLFKDRCTNEAAMNPPAQPAPQQTGQLDQQYQQQYVQPQPQPQPK
jgi:hypothetical protein